MPVPEDIEQKKFYITVDTFLSANECFEDVFVHRLRVDEPLKSMTRTRNVST